MNLFNLIGQIFKPAAEMIDQLHTSQEEKLNAKARLLETHVGFLEHALNFETQALQAKAAIITAEAQSEHWITATWRPITMLSFVAAILAYWFGLTPTDASTGMSTIPQSAVDAMFLLVQIGIGGYVVGRSAEKTAAGIVRALKKPDQILP